MATEIITIDDYRVETLRELLRPGLRAVIVGINPSSPSVAAGHYYQGRLGRRIWSRLQVAGIVAKLTPGGEDDDAYAQGIGFADLVREPSATAAHLTPQHLAAHASDLHARLDAVGTRVVLFSYKKAHDAAADCLQMRGMEVHLMPGFYSPREEAKIGMAGIAEAIGTTSVRPS
jgi:double-stranded uracil-DNA glycosylase